MPGSRRAKAFRAGELLSYTVGAILTGFFVVQLAQGEVERREGIAAFEQLAQAAAAAETESYAANTSAAVAALDNAEVQGATGFEVGEPDTSLWAPGRIEDYQASLTADLPPLLGVLEISSVGLKVPVYSTSNDLTMDRGAGVIDGMAYPHEEGNIGISGHRDGYFRVLKDIQPGDEIVLQTLKGPKKFTIDSTKVVEIADTSLLQDTWDQTLTLVTCYPFYFVGHAPKRFIVTASLD
jgi:LPXTG-site transpeptidase (sortase) family protein